MAVPVRHGSHGGWQPEHSSLSEAKEPLSHPELPGQGKEKKDNAEYVKGLHVIMHPVSSQCLTVI